MTEKADRGDVDGGVKPATVLDLARQTPPEEIKQRQAYGRNGPVSNPDGTPKMLDYVDARYVQETLDEVVGPENWQTRFEDTTMDGVRCGIGINVGGNWVWKWDAGVPSNIEPVKGAHSDAFKRAGVQWGIARDLYGSSVVTEAEDVALGHPAVVVHDSAAEAATVRQQVQGNAGRGGRNVGASPVAAAPVSQANTATNTDTRTVEELEEDADVLGIDWNCPIHGTARIAVAGNTKAPPHYLYQARFRCAERNCQEKGPIIPEV